MVKAVLPLILVLAADGVRASDVYQNITTPVGTFHTLLASMQVDSLERGNQINLGGTERIASRFSWVLHPVQNGVAMFEARVRFYANDGPGGQPGSLLWDSGLVHYLTDSGPNMTLALPLPSITLPNTFTWTIQVFNRSGLLTGTMGPAHYNPPTVGSAPFGYWERSAQGQWTYTGQNEPPFGARLEAIACYANCDGTTAPPVVNVNDFVCFAVRFAAGDPYANCDGSTSPPTLNVGDFVCFQQQFAAGCP